MRLAKRFEEIRNELGFSDQIEPINLKTGVQLIEAASLEDDDGLQDLYARLLATATNPHTKAMAKRAFVSILQDLGPLEVQLLDLIYSAPSEDNIVGTGGFPERHLSKEERDARPSTEVEIALWTLAKTGCIEPGGTWGGGSTVAAVSITALGRTLVEAAIRGPK